MAGEGASGAEGFDAVAADVGTVVADMAGNEESSEALALLTQMVLITLVFVVGWQLEKRHVSWISEAAVGSFAGDRDEALAMLAGRFGDELF